MYILIARTGYANDCLVNLSTDIKLGNGIHTDQDRQNNELDIDNRKSVYKKLLEAFLKRQNYKITLENSSKTINLSLEQDQVDDEFCSPGEVTRSCIITMESNFLKRQVKSKYKCFKAGHLSYVNDLEPCEDALSMIDLKFCNGKTSLLPVLKKKLKPIKELL